MTPLSFDDLLGVIDKEIEDLRNLAKVDLAQSKAWPAGSRKRLEFEATAGTFNYAARRLSVLRHSSALANHLAEDLAA